MTQSLSHYLPQILAITLMGVSIPISFYLVDRMTRNLTALGGVFDSGSLMPNLMKIGAVSIVVITCLSMMGIPIAPILTALGIGGLAVALALQDTLANLFAGLYIAFNRPLKHGDYVKIDPGQGGIQEGVVTDLTLRYTKLLTSENTTIVIPNTKIASGVVINYSFPTPETLIHIPITLDAPVELSQLLKDTEILVNEFIKTQPEIDSGFVPIIRFSGLGSKSVTLTTTFRLCRHSDRDHVVHEWCLRFGEQQKQI